MSATIDANIWVYGSNAESEFVERSAELLSSLSNGPDLLYVFWPTVTAYVRVTTHPNLFRRPLTMSQAWDNVEAMVSRPSVRLVGEQDDFLGTFREVSVPVPASGTLIHDAHIVALMRAYGVSTIYSNDRDYRKFDGIRVIDPFA